MQGLTAFIITLGVYYALWYGLAVSGVAGLTVFVPLVLAYVASGNLSWRQIQADREEARAVKLFRQSLRDA